MARPLKSSAVVGRLSLIVAVAVFTIAMSLAGSHTSAAPPPPPTPSLIPATISLEPASATLTVGATHTVTATVRDALGAPVSGIRVRFSVTGANAAGPANASTNASGVAGFGYSGANAGNDSINAFADAAPRNNRHDPAEPVATPVVMTWTSPTPVPTPTAIPTPSRSPVPTPTTTPVPTPTPTPSAGPISSPVPTAGPTPPPPPEPTVTPRPARTPSITLLPRPARLRVAPFTPPPAPAYHARWELQSEHPVAGPGEIVEWVVAFRNTGWAGWYRGLAGANAALGTSEALDNLDAAALGLDPGVWPEPARPAYQTTEYVGPDQVGWFVVQLRAPSQAGVYTMRVRPVIDRVTWMEDSRVFVVLTVTAN